MTAVTIVQPVATIHNDCGYMIAIRVVLLTVNTSTSFIRAKQPMLLSSLTSMKIEQICDIKVKEISLLNLREDTYLRNLIWCKNNGVRGVRDIAAVLSDGTVAKAHIHQYIGGVDGYGYSRYITHMDTGYCLDYMGNCVPLTQLGAVEAEARAALLRDNEKPIQPSTRFAWGNLSYARHPLYSSMCTNKLESEKHKRALSAAQLTLPSATCTAEQLFSVYAYKTTAEYQVTDDISPTQIVPLGFGMVKIRSRVAALDKRVYLQKGTAELRMDVITPIQIISEDYISACFINCAHVTAPFQLPKIASVPGSKIAATLSLNVANAEYTDTDWDISKDIYDIGRMQVMMKEQPCRSMTIPAVNSMELSLWVTNPYFMLCLVKPAYKYMTEGMLREYNMARACAYIHYTEAAQNIVVDASRMRDNLRLIFTYQGTVARPNGACTANIMLPKTARGAEVAIAAVIDLNEKYTGTQGLKRLEYVVSGATLGTCAVNNSIAYFGVHIEEFKILLGAANSPCTKHIYLSGGVDSIIVETQSMYDVDLSILLMQARKQVVLHVSGDIESVRLSRYADNKRTTDLEAEMIKAGLLIKV